MSLLIVENDEEFTKLLPKISFDCNIVDGIFYSTTPAYIIEEKVELQIEPSMTECTYTPVLYLLGNKVIRISRQLVKQGVYVGNRSLLFNTDLMKKLEHQIAILKETVVKFNKGPWGVDYLVDSKGNPLTTDINVGRFNSGFMMTMFMQMYGLEDKHYLSRKMDTHDWEGLFEKLEKQGLMFNFLKKIGIMLLTPDNNFFSNCLFWVTVKKKK